MISSRLELKALGLFAMLVGMFAFAGTAQAESGASWLVNGAKFAETLLPTVEAETDVKEVLLTTLGGKEVDISCETILLVGAHLVEPNGKILGKIIFHGCDFLTLNGGKATLLKVCEPFVGANKGLIETQVFTGLIKLHEEKPVLVAKPPAGGLFATINLPEECAFGEEMKIGNGENKLTKKILEAQFAWKDCKAGVSECKESAALVDTVKHLVEELPTLTSLYVNQGETKATIMGSAWAFLGEPHKGATFAAHAM
jgi:hypothetical protein